MLLVFILLVVFLCVLIRFFRGANIIKFKVGGSGKPSICINLIISYLSTHTSLIFILNYI